MDHTVTFAGDTNIGVFCRVIGEMVIFPPDTPEEFREACRSALGAEPVITTVQGSSIVGSLVAGNSRGLIVSGLVTEDELAILSQYREVMPLCDAMNAAGNVIMANDTFAAVHPEMPSALALEVGDFLGVEVIPLTLGGVKTVGMAGVATNKGVLVHPRATDEEISRLETVAGVPVGTGTINMGSGLVGTGLLVNEKGYLAGTATSGFELGRIEDVFGFLE